MTFNVSVEDTTVRVVSPEGQEAKMPLDEVLRALQPPSVDTGNTPLPAGLVYVKSRGRTIVWWHQMTPRVWNLRWIDGHSEKRYDGAEYRDVALSLPYIITAAVFVRGPGGKPMLSNTNECFFRNAPLTNYECDELLVPGLLNCSLFAPTKGRNRVDVDGKPLVWICTQHLDPSTYRAEPDDDHRMLRAFEALLHTLLHTGFNYSSEAHEGTSGFTESTRIDPRIATVAAWEGATATDPDFALTVPWIKTGFTIRQATERIFEMHGQTAGARSAHDIARVVFRQSATETP